MSIRAKTVIENTLRGVPPLYRLASRVYHKVNNSFRTLSPGAPGAIRKAFELARDQARGGEVGDYYEFGVFRGFTFLSAQRACDELGITDTRFYGFDSFQGLPPTEGVDAVDTRFFEGQFACRKPEVIQNLTRQGFDWTRAELIEGFFSDSLTAELKSRLPRRRAAVVVLDCDLYSSTQEALAWLSDLLGDGSILLFDDWYSFGKDPDKGQPKAFREFLDQHPHLRAEEGWEFTNHGKVFTLRAV